MTIAFASPAPRAGCSVGYGLRALTVIGMVAVLQVGGWSAAAFVYRHNQTMLAMAGIAFLLGLRHALDADHIAAIDNASRSIAGRGERAAAVGLFFALGHSSVVLVTTFVVATAATRVLGVFEHVRAVAASYSTLLSIGVLFFVAPRNLSTALRIYRTLRSHTATDALVSSPAIGFIARLVRPLLRLQVQSWHMMFIGILFGLGFETATAISVLVLAGVQSGAGVSIGAVMIIPLLFTAGMTLADASDGLFMERAYGWALRDPKRHAIYNLIVTSLSGSVAMIVGGIELLTLIRRFIGEHGLHFGPLDLLNEHFDLLGAGIVATFALIWIAARLVTQESSRYRRLNGLARSREIGDVQGKCHH